MQLQQKALEVDSGRVSSAIQNLINSWKASDSESDQATETSSSGRQVLQGSDGTAVTSARPNGKPGSDGSSSPDPPGEDEQQEEKRNRLLSLFYRGRNGQQQQPEELMPLRVITNLVAFAHVLAHIYIQPFCGAVTTYWQLATILDSSHTQTRKQGSYDAYSRCLLCTQTYTLN